jgi:hypothetical protein
VLAIGLKCLGLAAYRKDLERKSPLLCRQHRDSKFLKALAQSLLRRKPHPLQRLHCGRGNCNAKTKQRMKVDKITKILSEHEKSRRARGQRTRPQNSTDGCRFQPPSNVLNAEPWRSASGSNKPISFGIGADPGHRENRSPSTVRRPRHTDAGRPRGDRAQARPTAGQNTSSHGVPARGADRGRPQHIAAGGQATPVPAGAASRRATRSPFGFAAPALISSPRVLTPIALY